MSIESSLSYGLAIYDAKFAKATSCGEYHDIKEKIKMKHFKSKKIWEEKCHFPDTRWNHGREALLAAKAAKEADETARAEAKAASAAEWQSAPQRVQHTKKQANQRLD